MAGMDFLVNFAATIASNLVCGAIHEGSYCCRFNNFIKDLKKEKEQLIKCKKNMDDRVKNAKAETKIIDSVVEGWLQEAEILIKEAEELEEKAEKNKSCCTGCNPNWVHRYYLSKQLAEKKETIRQHYKKCHNSGEIARPAPLLGMKYYSSHSFMKFESRDLVHEQLMEALKDEGISMIGLYGMGGCGKTTLAEQVGKEAEQFFETVVYAVVSSNAEVRKIQDRIASSLQFQLNEKEEPERAQRLWMKLSSADGKVLLILDDVWKKLDFKAIGIPFRENGKSCKVLMTTRSSSICELMGCQKTIFLRLLSFEESWVLFQKYACITNETSISRKDLAKEITKKCDGLPVAIAAVASTLKGKTQDEWDLALKTLKDSRPIDIEEGLRDPYTCLELSYISLKNQEAKSLFLLCSAFPEDWDIDVELLTRYAIGVGLFEGASSYKMARKQVKVAKSRLINSCLLLKVDDEEEEKCVKMHDLVRDVALWIANKENKVILGPERYQDVMEKGMTVKDNQIGYLSCYKLPKQLDCPKLEFLYVYTDSKQVQVPCEYFEGKGKLRVLVLENEGHRDIPVNLKSIQTLTCLRCLVLIDWELVDISFIGCLKVLESLVLKGCSFQKLPEAIEQLTLLEVSDCKIEMNPYEMIGKYSSLEELYFIGNNGPEWKFNVETASELVAKFSAPQKLQRYRVELGKGFNNVGGSVSRILAIEYFDASTSSVTIMDLVGKAEALSLGHIKGDCKNIIPDIVKGMTDLIELEIHHSEEIKCLIDGTNLHCEVESEFSKLSILNISEMHHLESLCYGRPSPVLFEELQEINISECSELHGVLFVGKLNLRSLKILEVNECPKLTSIFTLDSAPSLSKLQDLKIEICNELKHIIIEEVNEEITKDDNDRMKKLPDLKLLSLSFLPSIVSIFPRNYIPVCPSLRELDLNDCPQFIIATLDKCVTVGSEAMRQHQDPPMEMDPLIIDGNQKNDDMPRLQTLLDIETLTVTESNIESIFQVAGLPLNTELAPPLTFRLKFLSLDNLHELNFICKGHVQMMSFQNLVTLEIYRCGKIKSIFSACSFGSMPQLEELKVRECSQLEQIIVDEECQNTMSRCHTESSPNSSSNSSTLHSGSLDLCNLKQLILDECPMLRSLFTLPTVGTLTSLEYLLVSRCDGLKEIINCESSCGCKKKESHFQRHFSMLFPKLGFLSMEKCNSLECIFPVPFNQGLMGLKYINIQNAPQLQYLFREGNLEHQYQNIIQFELPVLKYLTLKNLPNLISICPGNYHVVCSSLQEIRLAHVGLSNPTRDSLTDGSEDRQWDYTSTKDLRATIMKLLQNSKSEEHVTGKENDLLLVREMKLLNQNEIKYLCISPKRRLNFQNLLQLRVEECGKLKAMFSVSVLRSMPQLKQLIIIKCEELEQITIEDEEDENMSNPYSQRGCSPHLKVLYIKRCNKLKRLFPISMSRKFPELECIIIEEVSLLEEVFGREKGETEERKELLLPKLKYLILVKLPSLTNVCRVIESQTVTCRVVQNCPKLRLATALRKSYYQLRTEISGDILRGLLPNYLYMELTDILYTTTKTLNEDPVVESEVSDSEDKAASGSEPPSSQNIKEKGKGIAGNGSASGTLAIATPSTAVHESMDEQPINKPTLLGQQLAFGEPKLTTKVPQQISTSSDQNVEATPNKGVKESHTSKKDLIATSSDDFGSLPEVSAQEPINTRSETIMKNQQNFGEMKSNTHSNASHNGDLPIKMFNTKTSLTDLEAESSLHESSLQVLVKKDSMTKSIRDREFINDALLEKTFAQISSNPALSPFSSTSKNLLAELSTRSGVDKLSASTVLEPGFLQELRTKLTQYFNMPLEAIFETNALDDVESIVNSLAKGTTDVMQKNILEDFKSRLKQFQQFVPKAISTMQLSLGFMSNYESLNVELNTKLSEGQEKLRDLESKISETVAKEHEIDMGIQQLFAQKMEILEQRKLLASQLNHSTEAVSKDYVKWKALGEKLKVSTENWLKSKEDLAHANATWKLFKESLGL